MKYHKLVYLLGITVLSATTVFANPIEDPTINETLPITEPSTAETIASAPIETLPMPTDDPSFYPELQNVNEEQDNIKLVYNENGYRIFYNIETNTYFDVNGIVENNRLYELNILEYYNPLESRNSVPVTVNAKVKWVNCEPEDTYLNSIILHVESDVFVEDGDENYISLDDILLSENNEYQEEFTFDCPTEIFYINPEIPLDKTNSYRLKLLVNDEEVHQFSSEMQLHEIVLEVLKPKETSLDVNEAPELSEDWDKIESGEIAKENAQKNGYDFGENEVVVERTEPTETNHVSLVILKGVVGIFILGALVILFIKLRNNKKEDSYWS